MRNLGVSISSFFYQILPIKMNLPMLVPTTPWGVKEGVTVTDRKEPRIFWLVVIKGKQEES